MNYKRIVQYCELSPELAKQIRPEMLHDYLAFLYRVARTGGHTTEEEVFVENLASLLDADPALLRQAVRQSQDESEDIRAGAARLKGSPLAETAYLDACRLTRLDNTVSSDERHALAEAQTGLGLSSEFAETAQALVMKQDHLLHAFCHLADSPDPVDLWAVYLSEGMRQSDRQRRIILPDPESTSIDERIRVLALTLKLAGVGWRRSVKECIVHNLTEFLALGEAERERAMEAAWDMDSSLLGLAKEIQTRPLQLIALGDAYRVCLSDTFICTFEQALLRDLATALAIEAELAESILDLSHDEAAFLASVEAGHPGDIR